jgi:hypothetical protein
MNGTICLNCVNQTTQTLQEYFALTFSRELTSALFISVIYGLVVFDIRRHLEIETFFKKFNVPLFLRILIFPLYWIAIVTIGLIGVFVVVYYLFYLDRIFL